MNAGRLLLSRATTVLPREGTRSATSLARLKELQKQFQKDDGLPVYLKGGKSDKYIVRFIYICTFLATCNSIYWMRQHAKR